MKPPGLVHVPTPRLEALLRALAAGTLAAPLTPPALMTGGFHDLYDQLGALAGLDAAGVRACLVAVLAERKSRR